MKKKLRSIYAKYLAKIPVHYLFLTALLLVVVLYNYAEHFLDLPKGNHTWRQTDCTSLALNYYQDGLNPFKPRIHHALSGGGYGVGEFPILSYITALLYYVFGVHEGIFRTLNLLFFCTGLFALFLLIRDYTKNIYIAFVLPLMVWASPVLGFYSFNFLSDAPALGMSLCGLYFFFKYYEQQKQQFLNISTSFFLLAGLLKITALIPFIALLGIFSLEFLGVLNFKNNDKLFPNKWKTLAAFSVTLVGVFLWYYTAIQYNEAHLTNYFSTRTWPYYSLDDAQKDMVWYRTFVLWYPQFSHPYIHAFFATSIFMVLVTPKNYSKFEYLLLLLCSIGILVFFYLWAFAFIDHEYYMINLVYPPILGVTFFFKMLTRDRPQIAKHWLMALGLLGLVSFCLYKTKHYIHNAYKPERFSIPAAYYDTELDDFLKLHDINSGDIYSPNLGISMPDGSPNSTLYILNLKGWSELYGMNIDTTNVAQFANWGVKYLVINDTTYLTKPVLQPLLKYPIGNFKNQIFFYNLEQFKTKD